MNEPRKSDKTEGQAGAPDHENETQNDQQIPGDEQQPKSGWTDRPEDADDMAAEQAPGAALDPSYEELRDQLLRALAESENVRRRAQRDVADARQYAISGFARDMLSVADNFARALASVPEGEIADEPAVKSLIEGIEVTGRELHNALEKHGIRTVDPEGERFDPNLHQAMFEIENPEVPAGTIVQVMQKGSMIGDRVLRPAMVGVAKGGPKTPKPEVSETSADPASEG